MNRVASSPAAIDVAAFALIAAGALGTYWLGIAPAQRARAAELENRAALAFAKDQLDGAALQLESSKRSLEALQAQVNENTTVLRPGSDLFARIAEITQKAQSRSLTISGTNPSPPIVGKRSTRIPIHLSGVGSYANFAAFLDDLHASYADLQVLSFKLTSRAEDARTPGSFEADLSWYISADKPRGSGSGEAGK